MLKGRLNSIFFLFQAVFVKKVQIGFVNLHIILSKQRTFNTKRDIINTNSI